MADLAMDVDPQSHDEAQAPLEMPGIDHHLKRALYDRGATPRQAEHYASSDVTELPWSSERFPYLALFCKLCGHDHSESEEKCSNRRYNQFQSRLSHTGWRAALNAFRMRGWKLNLLPDEELSAANVELIEESAEYEEIDLRDPKVAIPDEPPHILRAKFEEQMRQHKVMKDSAAKSTENGTLVDTVMDDVEMDQAPNIPDNTPVPNSSLMSISLALRPKQK